MSSAQKIVQIIGARGMLGQMCCKYFGEKCHVIPVTERFTKESKRSFVDRLNEYPGSVVINAIGRIKQKSDDDLDLLWANSVLPLELVNRLDPSITLVHPSTDCVFDGLKGNAYAVSEEPDAEDIYGWSKRLGEVSVCGRPNSIVFRVSIIGPDANSSKGLLGWFLSNESGAQLKGFTNHLWNGITTLEWCQKVEMLLQDVDHSKHPQVIQGGTTEHYTKEEMLHLFQRHYATEFTIEGYETEVAIDRRLVPDVISPTLDEQLSQLTSYK